MAHIERNRWVPRVTAAAAVLAAGLLVGTGISERAGATKPAADGTHKVTICHRTSSDKNPYVAITVDRSAADGSLGKGGDHTGHDGPVWAEGLKADHVKWGDIIPPYTFDGGSFPGQNWTPDGQAIHESGCGAPDGPPPPPDPCPYDPSIPADDPACVPPG